MKQNEFRQRLIGSATLALEQGVVPVYIAVGAAAAMYRYIKENDKERNEANALQVLQEVSQLQAGSQLADLILDYYRDICCGATIAQLLAKADKAKFASLSNII